MKTLLILSLAFGSISAFSYDQVDCFKKVEASIAVGLLPPLENSEKVILCNSATSEASIQCFRAAKGLTVLSNYGAAFLCSGTESNAPVDCYKKAQRSLVNYNGSPKLNDYVALCSKKLKL